MPADLSHLLAARWGSGGGITLVRFELTEAPVEDEGCPALIVVYGWNPDAVPPAADYHALPLMTIEVWWMGVPDAAAAVGDQGYAVWWADSQRFEVIGMAGGSSVKRGVMDNTLTEGGTATVSIWTRTAGPTYADSGENIAEVGCFILNVGESIAAGRKVYVAKIAGHWEVVSINCPVI